MKVESLAEQLLFTTVRIEVEGPAGSGSGTGFIFSTGAPGLDGQALFLVTNKHVIHDFDRASFFFTLADDQAQPLIGQRFDVQIDDLQSRWHGHPNPAVDVTVTPLVPILELIRDAGQRVFYRSISSDLIPSPQQLEILDAIEDIRFVGYPNGIYDQRNLLPVTRRGITATPLQVDYNGEPLFLIDASVFGGSSGSPVFIANESGFAQRGGFNISSRLYFIGVIASVAYVEEEGTIAFKAAPTANQPVAVTRQMIDLGVVFKAATVLETAQSFCAPVDLISRMTQYKTTRRD
jgi:hypothetical protein